MAGKLKDYSGPSELKISYSGTRLPMLSEMQRGQLFLRDGAVCMKVDVGGNNEGDKIPEPRGYGIINLGTGRVWFADDCPVERVQATMNVYDRQN